MKRLTLLLLLLASSSQAVSLVSRVTGNFTAAGTWGTVDATSLLDSEAGSTACTTSQVNSSNFTPGIITNDGVAVKLASRVASPTGTITITLRNTTAGSDLVSTTINVSQLPSSGNGWQFFKWGSSQVLLAATNYAVGFTCSVNAEATLFRDGTAGNWSRMLSTTTTAAPGANDLLYILGELTGAGTGNDITVTMDQTATTSFGTTTPPQSFATSNRGILTWGTASSTTYKLAHAGVFACYGGSTVNFGTSGTRMPSTSSGTWTATVASNVDTGWVLANGCTFNAYGATKTSIRTTLTVDLAGGGTSVTVGDTTGWVANDVIAVGSTTRTPSQAESLTISAVNSATNVTTGAAGSAHSGTSPIQAFVGNLTRNVKFTGTSSSLEGYILLGNTATVNMDYVEMNNLGSGTANKRGLDVQTTTGSSSITNSGIHDFIVASSSVVFSNAAGGNWTFSGNVVYNIGIGFTIAVTTGTWTVDSNYFIKHGSSGPAVTDVGGTFTNNVLSSMTNDCLDINESSATVFGTWSGNTFQSCGAWGMQITNTNLSTTPYTFSNTTVWRNNGGGILWNAVSSNPTFNTLTMFGNVTFNMLLNASASGVTLNSITSNGDTTFATTDGIQCSTTCSMRINNGNFSTVSGIKTAHTQDLLLNTSGSLYQVVTNNTKMPIFSVGGSLLTTNGAIGSYVSFADFGQTAGDNRVYFPQAGSSTTDTVTFRTASPSVKLTPLTANFKLTTGNIYIPIASGTSTATLSAYVQKSTSPAYNGNTPRLVVVANPQAGSNYNTDYVCASGGGAGSFSQLTCTLPATTGTAMLVAYVDCDGTAGTINVSDITVATTATSLGNPTYFDKGFMSVTSGASGTAGGSSAINMRKGMQ